MAVQSLVRRVQAGKQKPPRLQVRVGEGEQAGAQVRRRSRPFRQEDQGQPVEAGRFRSVQAAPFHEERNARYNDPVLRHAEKRGGRFSEAGVHPGERAGELRGRPGAAEQLGPRRRQLLSRGFPVQVRVRELRQRGRVRGAL